MLQAWTNNAPAGLPEPTMARVAGYSLLLMDRYSKGILYIWIIPENFNDLYSLPPSVSL